MSSYCIPGTARLYAKHYFKPWEGTKPCVCDLKELTVLKLEGMRQITMYIQVNLHLLFMLLWAGVRQEVWPAQGKPGVWTRYGRDVSAPQCLGFQLGWLECWCCSHLEISSLIQLEPGWGCLRSWVQQDLLTKAPTHDLLCGSGLQRRAAEFQKGTFWEWPFQENYTEASESFFFFFDTESNSTEFYFYLINWSKQSSSCLNLRAEDIDVTLQLVVCHE